ncbi:membrane protein [Enterococcus sp. 10A9_DIV0425]|uniref:Membrane protein n=1 Tax=Candidatus Enterococcus wittei TaxID=1987383 RepID=A0A242K1G3_9ENTE|nr:folate family ECF transporter S component [Enterococcus sp. 10A9_DIV0425]OTP11403.1 membrane protein [Enterococcus sp. 10A9_DIV0425]THE11962.1 folate family ECF transporter S component [Enterococcus hirae]
MKKNRLDARMIAIMGLLIALMVTLSRLVAFETPFLKVSMTFVPQVIMGILFGPFWTGIGSVLADIVGMALFPKSLFFIGFTLNAFIEGAIYGFFFYRKEVTWKNSILATLSVTVIISLILTPLWLALMYQVPLLNLAFWLPRLIKAVVWLPIQSATIYVVGRTIPYKRILKSLTIHTK